MDAHITAGYNGQCKKFLCTSYIIKRKQVILMKEDLQLEFGLDEAAATELIAETSPHLIIPRRLPHAAAHALSERKEPAIMSAAIAPAAKAESLWNRNYLLTIGVNLLV